VTDEAGRVDAPQVLANSRAMATKLTSLGYKLVSGGTDNHLVRGRGGRGVEVGKGRRAGAC
jgi:glycine/serine hydroxymethyltransferase